MLPQISVIVPIYNVENYIHKCVGSLLNQTYPNLEIILVDDGSPDACPVICDEFEAKHKNITVYHKKNGGLSDARNYGVENATSEWIVFVDSDDYVEDKYVEHLWNLLCEFNADMAVSSIVREIENTPAQSRPQRYRNFVVDKEQAIFEIYLGENVDWNAYGKIFRRENLLRHPFPNGFYEDSACMYFQIHLCNKIAIGDYAQDYHYIYRSGSILNNQLTNKHYHVFDIAREFVDFIHEFYPNLEILEVIFYKRAIVQVLNLQTMPWDTYREIYNRYKSLFRKNLIKVISDTRLSYKQKSYLFLLCLTPEIYYLQRKIIKIILRK